MTRRRVPATLWIGLLIMFACEAVLFLDVHRTGRPPLHTHQQVLEFRAAHPPVSWLDWTGRWISVNMTAVVWVGYLTFLEGVLHLQGDSPVRRRPHHFFLLALASIFIWCVFDAINFYSIRAWRYIGMPDSHAQRMLGYFLAFATIVPGMLMTGQALLNLGAFTWARTPASPAFAHRIRRILPFSLLAGLAMLLWPIFHPNPITNLTLWTSLVFLLDPLNHWLGRPSMFRDWENGWFGRTLAAFSGGLLCGFLWEFWNYWALTKWTYHLPFLGATEGFRYFEMPVLGLIGFIPFGIECWVMWQTLRIPLDGLAEPLPGDRHLL